ncbi:MAG TPA: hypothetical protein VKP11_04060 [Frankiaceae bacterium]|nr:hypothetical protein [Frankiaceae bacterium]
MTRGVPVDRSSWARVVVDLGRQGAPRGHGDRLGAHHGRCRPGPGDAVEVPAPADLTGAGRTAGDGRTA